MKLSRHAGAPHQPVEIQAKRLFAKGFGSCVNCGISAKYGVGSITRRRSAGTNSVTSHREEPSPRAWCGSQLHSSILFCGDLLRDSFDNILSILDF